MAYAAFVILASKKCKLLRKRFCVYSLKAGNVDNNSVAKQFKKRSA